MIRKLQIKFVAMCMILVTAVLGVVCLLYTSDAADDSPPV